MYFQFSNLVSKIMLLFFINEFSVVLAILFTEIPKFSNLMKNVTVTLGRDAVLLCAVDSLSTYKIAWLRVDTQTILTIQNHVITKNYRIAVSNEDKSMWKLHIKNVKHSDKGWYMCQINTDPMKSQTAFIDVVAPPDILDYPTSSDMIVSEGNNVTLNCAVSGSPTPIVTWRKEDGSDIYLDQSSNKASRIKNSVLSLQKVDWRHSGIYLCVASNGVPPTVSKRISLTIEHAPKVYIRNQLIGTMIGESIMLECETEAFPKPIYYWTQGNGQLLSNGIVSLNIKYLRTLALLSSCNIGIVVGDLHETMHRNHLYKIKITLLIKDVTKDSFGNYYCVSKNPLGMTEGVINVYPIDNDNTETSFSTFPRRLETLLWFLLWIPLIS